MGLASPISEREDSVLCSDVRNNLFGPMEFSRRDLGRNSINIFLSRNLAQVMFRYVYGVAHLLAD